jgi:hypothetical protein
MNRFASRSWLTPQPEVVGVSIVIVGLNVAVVSVVILKLTLNDKILAIVSCRIDVIGTGGRVVKRDLQVLVAGHSNG